MKYKKEIELLINLSKEVFEESEVLFKSRKYRGTVSRCYYSMFYSAQAVLLTKNIQSRYFQHKTIISKFGEFFAKTGIFPAEMRNDFNKAAGKRIKGDYEYNKIFSREDTVPIIEKGRKFNQTIENYIRKEMKIEHID